MFFIVYFGLNVILGILIYVYMYLYMLPIAYCLHLLPWVGRVPASQKNTCNLVHQEPMHSNAYGIHAFYAGKSVCILVEQTHTKFSSRSMHVFLDAEEDRHSST